MEKYIMPTRLKLLIIMLVGLNFWCSLSYSMSKDEFDEKLSQIKTLGSPDHINIELQNLIKDSNYSVWLAKDGFIQVLLTDKYPIINLFVRVL